MNIAISTKNEHKGSICCSSGFLFFYFTQMSLVEAVTKHVYNTFGKTCLFVSELFPLSCLCFGFPLVRSLHCLVCVMSSGSGQFAFHNQSWNK